MSETEIETADNELTLKIPTKTFQHLIQVGTRFHAQN